jgi:DNA-binding transcriptional LysR family regulator
MIAVRIAPDMRMVVVGSPDYLARYPRPLVPEDLTRHDCIGLRLASHGGLLKWEFTRRRKTVNAHVTGRLVFNSSELILAASLAGHGLAWLPLDAAEKHISAGRLLPVLDEWATTFAGYHLYYASRRASPALLLVVEALRPQSHR